MTRPCAACKGAGRIASLFGVEERIGATGRVHCATCRAPHREARGGWVPDPDLTDADGVADFETAAEGVPIPF